MLSIPFFVFGSFLALAIIGDAITTHIGVKIGGKEVNPVFAWFKYPAILVAIVGLSVVAVVWWAAQYEPMTARVFCLLFGIFRSYFAYRNYKTIQEAKKKS